MACRASINSDPSYGCEREPANIFPIDTISCKHETLAQRWSMNTLNLDTFVLWFRLHFPTVMLMAVGKRPVYFRKQCISPRPSTYRPFRNRLHPCELKLHSFLALNAPFSRYQPFWIVLVILDEAVGLHDHFGHNHGTFNATTHSKQTSKVCYPKQMM